MENETKQLIPTAEFESAKQKLDELRAYCAANGLRLSAVVTLSQEQGFHYGATFEGQPAELLFDMAVLHKDLIDRIVTSAKGI